MLDSFISPKVKLSSPFSNYLIIHFYSYYCYSLFLSWMVFITLYEELLLCLIASSPTLKEFMFPGIFKYHYKLGCIIFSECNLQERIRVPHITHYFLFSSFPYFQRPVFQVLYIPESSKPSVTVGKKGLHCFFN